MISPALAQKWLRTAVRTDATSTQAPATRPWSKLMIRLTDQPWVGRMRDVITKRTRETGGMAGITDPRSPSAPPPTAPASGPGRRRSWWRWALYALVLFALNYALVAVFAPAPTTQRVNVPYTLFSNQVQAGNVASITAQGDNIQGQFKQPVSYTPPNATAAVQVTTFATVQPALSDPTLLSQLEQQGVVVDATSLDQTTPAWLNLLLSFGPTVLPLGA